MSAIPNEVIDDDERSSPAIPDLASGKAEGTAWLLTPVFVRLLVTNAMYGYSLASYYLLPKYLILEFGATPTQIGRVTGIHSLASLLALPFLIPLLHRLGYRRATVWGYVLIAISSLLFPFLPTLGLPMLALRALQGLAASVVFSSGLSLVSAFAPPHKLSQAMGLVGAASLSMGAIAPALGEALAARFGFSLVFLIAAAAALVGALVARALPDGESQPALPSASGPLGSRDLLIVLVVVGAGFNVVMAFLAPFALSRGFQTVGVFFVSYTLAALFVRLFCDALTQRLGNRRTASFGVLLYGLVIVGIGILGPGQRILLGFFFGIAHGGLFPALMALVFEGVAGPQRTRLAVVSNSLMHLGMMSVFVFGPMADAVGFVWVFTALGAVVAFSSRLIRRTSPGDMPY